MERLGDFVEQHPFMFLGVLMLTRACVEYALGITHPKVGEGNVKMGELYGQ